MLRSEAEVAAAVAEAAGPLRVVGGGTRGARIAAATPLSVAGLTGVTRYEPGALTIVAAAGTPVAEIEAALAAEGQRLPFEPMDHRRLLGGTGTPTIGGVVAANVSGPRRVQAGACRDFLLGVRLVDGSGTVVKSGGRVMKNVTGYDLVKLMAGSWGTLGVLTEVAFKVLPAPEQMATLVLQDLTPEQAVAAMAAALGSPYEVTGAAHLPAGPMTLLRIEGFEASVRYRAAELQALLAAFGDSTVETDPARSAALWADVRDVQAFAEAPGDVWRISVKPSDGPAIAARAAADAVIFDWGGGLIWARLPGGTDLRARLGAFSGHATLVRAADDTPLARFHPEPPAQAALTAALRAKFDPRGILNPGLMG